MALSANVKINYSANGSADLSENISKQLSAFSYVDEASGKSDSISITVINIDMEWLNGKMPQKGATINATIKTKDWINESPNLNCGTFILDDISYSGRPLECVLDAVSVPFDNDFRTKEKTVTWQSTTIQDIAQKITATAGIQLYYSGPKILITEKEQNAQTDCAFLYDLCETYGLSMKVFNKKIVIFDTAEAEKGNAVVDLSEKDILKWQYNTTLDGAYTGIEFRYTNPDTSDKNNKKIKVVIGEKGRMYYANAQASSPYDAELQAKALFNKANRTVETMNVSIIANTSLVAGQCVNIKDLGAASGKYYIDQIKHSVGSGYTQQLTLHKVKSAYAISSNASRSSGSSGSGGNKASDGLSDLVGGGLLWAGSRTKPPYRILDIYGNTIKSGLSNWSTAEAWWMNGEGRKNQWIIIDNNNRIVPFPPPYDILDSNREIIRSDFDSFQRAWAWYMNGDGQRNGWFIKDYNDFEFRYFGDGGQT